jgi:hypothetical protein
MIRRYALIWMTLPALAGCADVARPRFLHPGSEQYQQGRAERFDPYPLPDVAPDIVGGRPMAYIKPAPWAERVQNETTYEERFHQVPPPGLYKPPRVNGRRQGVIYPVPAAQPLGVQPLMAPPGMQPQAVPPAYGQPPVVPLPQGTAPSFEPQAAQKWRAVG